MKKIITTILLTAFSLNAFAQYDSTNLPGLTAKNPPMVNFGGSAIIPDAGLLDATTTTTETEVLACPSGYYPNGSVPVDGSDTTQQINGGVVYDRPVTTDRFGTTVYGTWSEVNFLCTAMPPAPTCPSGQSQVSPPVWDSTTNQWTGLTCAAASLPITQINSKCQSALQTWVMQQPWADLAVANPVPDKAGNITYSGFTYTNNSPLVAQGSTVSIVNSTTNPNDYLVYYGLGMRLLDGSSALYVPNCSINKTTGTIDKLDASYLIYSCQTSGCGNGQ
ncbi:hypothetical protein [Burkholderia vietnamiensis]|uniref:hypothetical protein n=1 Tax=Burkholderia vietnamiensis TaxID=60552 RepID=UPI001CF410B1|nr:hypothetical protein [Burkholderia vietnamiensis]MCA8285400.1 hypothetical protein [Burkholderia vietnamiensis]